ncbi:MAG: hypothetical protein WC655_27775 [Candidatus Hydrogenedentales bacterium]|jgi:hypothetical protein
MLAAYFDESGEPNAEVTCVAGFVGDTIEWARAERDWLARLGKLAPFHSTDCGARDKQFSALKIGENGKLSQDLATILSKYPLTAVGCAVHRDDWRYAAANTVIERQYRTKYHFCMAMVLMQVNDLSEKHWRGEPIAFEFAEQLQYQDYAIAMQEVFRDSRDEFPCIGHMGIGRPECVVPLQAADLFSNEYYKELIYQREHPGETKPGRVEMQILCEELPVVGVYAGVEYLHEIANGMEALKSSSSDQAAGR